MCKTDKVVVEEEEIKALYGTRRIDHKRKTERSGYCALVLWWYCGDCVSEYHVSFIQFPGECCLCRRACHNALIAQINCTMEWLWEGDRASMIGIVCERRRGQRRLQSGPQPYCQNQRNGVLGHNSALLRLHWAGDNLG